MGTKTLLLPCIEHPITLPPHHHCSPMLHCLRRSNALLAILPFFLLSRKLSIEHLVCMKPTPFNPFFPPPPSGFSHQRAPMSQCPTCVSLSASCATRRSTARAHVCGRACSWHSHLHLAGPAVSFPAASPSLPLRIPQPLSTSASPRHAAFVVHYHAELLQ